MIFVEHYTEAAEVKAEADHSRGLGFARKNYYSEMSKHISYSETDFCSDRTRYEAVDYHEGVG